jgi:hypothetical protein
MSFCAVSVIKAVQESFKSQSGLGRGGYMVGVRKGRGRRSRQYVVLLTEWNLSGRGTSYSESAMRVVDAAREVEKTATNAVVQDGDARNPIAWKWGGR